VLYFAKPIFNIALFWRCKFLAKRKGERYKCETCGMVILVEDACGCNDCDIVCCATPMKKVKEEAKSKEKTKAKAVKPKK
jgi:hypothetical protein